jgi:D-alanyl-D-alanine carboxypeptidase
VVPSEAVATTPPVTTTTPGAVATAPEHDDVARLQQLADALVPLGSPGVLVHTETAGRDPVDVVAGVADLSTKGQMDPASHFRIASITKMFTATVVLQLAAERRIGLDQAVNAITPGLLADDRVTVRMLLNHTSGLGDLPSGLGVDSVLKEPRRVIDPRQILAAVKTASPPLGPPGVTQTYSNVGYLALGEVVATVSGTPVSEAIRTRILDPLRLSGTSWPTTPALPDPHPHGYLSTRPAERDQVDYTEIDPTFAGAAGSLVSTTADLAAFVRALAQGRLLSAEYRDPMVTPFKQVAKWRYGLGVEIFLPDCQVPYVGHAGALPGFGTFVATTTDGRRQVVLLTTNSLIDVPDPQHALDRLVEQALCPSIN